MSTQSKSSVRGQTRNILNLKVKIDRSNSLDSAGGTGSSSGGMTPPPKSADRLAKMRKLFSLKRRTRSASVGSVDSFSGPVSNVTHNKQTCPYRTFYNGRKCIKYVYIKC